MKKRISDFKEKVTQKFANYFGGNHSGNSVKGFFGGIAQYLSSFFVKVGNFKNKAKQTLVLSPIAFVRNGVQTAAKTVAEKMFDVVFGIASSFKKRQLKGRIFGSSGGVKRFVFGGFFANIAEVVSFGYNKKVIGLIAVSLAIFVVACFRISAYFWMCTTLDDMILRHVKFSKFLTVEKIEMGSLISFNQVKIVNATITADDGSQIVLPHATADVYFFSPVSHSGDVSIYGFDEAFFITKNPEGVKRYKIKYGKSPMLNIFVDDKLSTSVVYTDSGFDFSYISSDIEKLDGLFNGTMDELSGNNLAGNGKAGMAGIAGASGVGGLAGASGVSDASGVVGDEDAGSLLFSSSGSSFSTYNNVDGNAMLTFDALVNNKRAVEACKYCNMATDYFDADIHVSLLFDAQRGVIRICPIDIKMKDFSVSYVGDMRRDSGSGLMKIENYRNMLDFFGNYFLSQSGHSNVSEMAVFGVYNTFAKVVLPKIKAAQTVRRASASDALLDKNIIMHINIDGNGITANNVSLFSFLPKRQLRVQGS